MMPQSEEDAAPFVGGLSCGLLAAFVIWIIVHSSVILPMIHAEAVKAGAARYEADKDGNMKFVYIDSRGTSKEESTKKP